MRRRDVPLLPKTGIKNVQNNKEARMNEIIKNIEAAQLKAEVPNFNVGDTVKVYAKVVEGNKERIQVFDRRWSL